MNRVLSPVVEEEIRDQSDLPEDCQDLVDDSAADGNDSARNAAEYREEFQDLHENSDQNSIYPARKTEEQSVRSLQNAGNAAGQRSDFRFCFID